MYIPVYSELYRNDTSLRPYQQKAKKEIFDAWDEVDNVMFQMPTGTGKTRLFTSIISDINEYSKQRREAVKILIIAHRTELIDQIDASLTKYRVPHNIIAGGREKNYKFPVNIASIQTLTHPNNLSAAKKLNVQFVIIDEAHHALARTYKKLWNLYPNAKRLGVTATPWRMNHQSFMDLFDKLVLSMPIKDFINQGYLAPYKYYSLKNDSDIQKTIDDIELDRFGEYKESSMEEKMDIGSIRAQLLDSYLTLAEGKKGIIYAINIVHAKHICDEYQKAGYNAVSIDSKTPAAERKELVDKFKRGIIDIIVNVDIFSEGFDCPDIEFIQLARPTRSLVKYLQQVGRGLRPTENKQNCVILDNVGMYSRFGLPDARRHWKYHFLGRDVVEEPKRVISKGNGGHRYVDISEGTEDMELIQDLYEDIEDTTDVNEVKSDSASDFDPTPILQANNYQDENFIFWFKENKRIYETYIQDDKYFIVSELVIDEEKHCVHRKRVGKIPMTSWMFWQMEREKVDNLISLVHFGSYYTVFHYQVLDKDKQTKDKYFDYKGREIDNPSVVKDKFEKAKREGQISDFIDVPISKAEFSTKMKSDKITISRTIKGVTSPIAIVPILSDFGHNHFIDAKELSQRIQEGRDSYNYVFYWSDHNSFTVRCVQDEITYLYKYDFNGKLIKKGTIAASEGELLSPLKDTDIDKLWHVFDKKATSYKYFWFLSILQIYKETLLESIQYRQLLIRMVANAWEYVFVKNGNFSQSDQLPRYLVNIQLLAKINKVTEGSLVEQRLNKKFESLDLNSLLSPLLKNVPYRFLSPWIPFTNNEDVMEKSSHIETKSLYSLHYNHITINDFWRRYLIDHYEELINFINKELASYLKLDQRPELLNRKFTTLSRLLKEIQSKEGFKVSKPFFELFDLPLTRKVTPSDILERIPASKWTIDKDGHKQINIRNGQWSLKELVSLLSN